jgi:hypothetical protein
MRRSAWVSILAVALLLVPAVPTHAWGWHGHPGVRARVFIGVGPIWWGQPYPYWYYPPPSYYAYPPPPVIVQEPPVYVQPEPAPAPSQSYWYYCPSAKAYYPNVQTCTEAWIPVPPRPR